MRIAAVMLALQSSFATSPLLAWLSEAPGAQTTHIELRASSVGNGIGAYLTRSVQAGEVLFAIPSSSFFSLGTALSHPQLGSAMHRLWESSQDDGGVAVLAGLLAHLQLNCDAPHPYLRMLPASLNDQNHVLWWTEDEIALLDGTAAYDEALSLRAEAEEVCDLLLSGALAADAARHGRAAVRGAVRDALVSVLSRSYGVLSSSGSECKALVPLLDMLNHEGSAPTVAYSFSGAAGDEGGGGEDKREGLLIARALCAMAAGDELLVTYGNQPDLIFGLHYGFVPAADEARTLAELEAVRAELADAVDARSGSHPDDVREAAQMQLEALERGESVSRASRRSVRACCETLSRDLRRSERRVLQRLCAEAPGAFAG